MLYIYEGQIRFEDINRPSYIYNIDFVFDYFFEDTWIDEWAKYILKEIDKSEFLSPKVIHSPVLDIIDYTKISGGTKTLILMNHYNDILYNGDGLGDNCWPYALELGKTKDIIMNLSYFPQFQWLEGTKATFLNRNRTVSSREEWLDEILENADSVRMDYAIDAIQWPIKLNENRFIDEIDF